jgi:hypothetical protein
LALGYQNLNRQLHIVVDSINLNLQKSSYKILRKGTLYKIFNNKTSTQD